MLIQGMDEIAMGLVEGSAEAKAYDGITFEAWLRQAGVEDERLRELALFTRGTIGVEPAELSALYWFLYSRNAGGFSKMISDSEHGAQYKRVREGKLSPLNFFNLTLLCT